MTVSVVSPLTCDFAISSRGNYPTAHQTYASLPAHYAPPKHPWPPLESFVLARSLDAHVKAGRDLDRAWLENALTFLGVCTVGGADEQWIETGNNVLTAEGRLAYLKGLVQDIRTAAEGIQDGEFDILTRLVWGLNLFQNYSESIMGPFLSSYQIQTHVWRKTKMGRVWMW